MSRSKLALVVGLIALAVPLAVATSAEAFTNAACTFDGATGSIDPLELPDGTPIAGDHPSVDTGVQSVLNDLSDGNVVHDWDGGGYTFSTQFTPTGRVVCVMDPPGFAFDGVFTGHLSSKGHYNNQVCGTGDAIDDDDPANEITRVDFDASPVDIEDADYEIDFTAGQGELDITNVDDTSNPDSPELDPPGPPDGYVTIMPDDTVPGAGNCVDQDVTRFLASGVFMATWLP